MAKGMGTHGPCLDSFSGPLPLSVPSDYFEYRKKSVRHKHVRTLSVRQTVIVTATLGT